ncbi:hypothetical protein NQ318_019915 [Aromia moschata]|uniref:RNase III domain-containing protein n=1 Tax=Aromia moschata TaxID=1265417 RepID=A0AAV8XJX5_9CUCU|nr:hypothetical protein NQ318_019915 [Aromia moschata]
MKEVLQYLLDSSVPLIERSELEKMVKMTQYEWQSYADEIKHAMLIPVLLALTHPSYRENFGTNPDHARNSLTNCGIRQPEYGDRRIHYMNTRKRGINTLINIMSRFGKQQETESNITHNERLEFLGDAVVEFLSSIHLFYSFPDLEEGGLATYRAAIVQNQHLALQKEIFRDIPQQLQRKMSQLNEKNQHT